MTLNKKVYYSMFPNWVQEGQTYHIRRVEDMGRRILLDEISNPPIYIESLMGNVEPGFSKKRFANYEDYILGNIREEEMEQEKIILN